VRPRPVVFCHLQKAEGAVQASHPFNCPISDSCGHSQGPFWGSLLILELFAFHYPI